MLFLTILALFAPLVASLEVPAQVPVAVYYETLCPDSIKFITSQLYPVYTSGLKSRLNVTLVPYGKAVKNSGPNGVTFECRHGPVECYGDKVNEIFYFIMVIPSRPHEFSQHSLELFSHKFPSYGVLEYT